MLKRSLAAVLAVCMMVVMLTACGGNTGGNDTVSTLSDTTSTVSNSMTESGVVDQITSDATSATGENGQTNNGTTNNGNTNTGNTSQTQSTGNNGTAGVRKQLKVWADSKDRALLVAVDAFEREHSDVLIQVSSPPAGDKVANLQMQIAAGNEPDIVTLDHVYITSLGRAGNLLNLASYGANDVKSKFIASCWEAVSSANGKEVYGLPHDGNTIALMYNKDMLDKTGLKAPTDYDSLVEVGQRMKSTSQGKTPYTSPFFDTADQGRKNWSAFVYFFWLWRCGGEILTDDLSAAAFNSQAGIDALTMLTDLVGEKQICAGDGYKESEFYNGNVGMIEMGNWSVPQLKSESRAADFDVTLLPRLKDNVPQYSGLGLFAMGVTAKTDYPQEAYDFIESYCTNDSLQLQYAKQNNQLPCTTSALNDSYYNEDIWNVYKEQYALSKSRPGVSNWDQIEAAVADAVNSAVKGTQTPKGALDAAAAKVNGYLK